MILGKVIGTVVATRKLESLVGFKLLMVEPFYDDNGSGRVLVAGDRVGAGIGEVVLVTEYSTTRYAVEHDCPIDAVIVGIVDNPPIIGK